MSSESFVAAEERSLQAEIKEVSEWFGAERFKFTKRPYSASQVATLRGNLKQPPLSNAMAKKLYWMLRQSYDKGQFKHTFGALDTVQVVQMAKYLDCVYVSGWQCSSTAPAPGPGGQLVGPDFADYASTTVPYKVEQLFSAQLFHDRKQREARSRMTHEQRLKTPAIDFLKPIIADGDTGFGGVTSVMKLTHMLVSAGAAGIHIEDQGVGVKKCGHLGGRVLVPVREHVDRLFAARLQCDIMGAETVIVARTDACGATFLSSNIDPRDHPFIIGSTNPDLGALEGSKLGEEAWVKAANMKTYGAAVADAMRKAGKSEAEVKAWLRESSTLGNVQARARAAQLGFGKVFWDWDAPRPREGYFRVQCGVEYSAMRAKEFSVAADIIWMETHSPDIQEADEFHKLVHADVPHQMLSYNLSPSFNWSVAGMDDDGIRRFQTELGKRGFVWHFITLAGFHTDALAIDQFAKAYAGPDNVLAYVKMIQREEARLKVETLTHQAWSGAEFMDNIMMTATGGGISTTALKGATEGQFHGDNDAGTSKSKL